jgi:hypothetical protein
VRCDLTFLSGAVARSGYPDAQNSEPRSRERIGRAVYDENGSLYHAEL